MRDEWASERKRLASAWEEWESKVRVVESHLGATAAKFDAGLGSLALLQRRWQVFWIRIGCRCGCGWETMKGGFTITMQAVAGGVALSCLLVRRA